MTEWSPAVGVATAMYAAVRVGDSQAYFDALVAAPLLLPVSTEDTGGRAALAWPTGVFEGRTHVIAFTSPSAIADALPGRSVSYRTATMGDLVRDWPNQDWLLAVDPGSPIGVRLTIEQLRQLPDPLAEAEEPLRDAVRRQDPDALMAALLRAEIVVPLRPGGAASRDLTDPDFPWWPMPDTADGISIAVFTSEQRMRQVLGEQDLVVISSLQLAESWPDPSWRLVVNPETLLEVALPGTDVLTLGAWLSQLRTAVTEAAESERIRLLRAEDENRTVRAAWAPEQSDSDGGDEPDPGIPLLLQLVIPHQYVPSYLEQHYHRAAGLIHAWSGPGRDTPLRLYRRLRLLGEGSPFSETDEWVTVLRWAPNDETPADWGRGRPRMEGIEVPDGAVLYRIHRDSREEPLARFDAFGRRWLPAS